jgi:hypothetical protein
MKGVWVTMLITHTPTSNSLYWFVSCHGCQYVPSAEYLNGNLGSNHMRSSPDNNKPTNTSTLMYHCCEENLSATVVGLDPTSIMQKLGSRYPIQQRLLPHRVSKSIYQQGYLIHSAFSIVTTEGIRDVPFTAATSSIGLALATV